MKEERDEGEQDFPHSVQYKILAIIITTAIIIIMQCRDLIHEYKYMIALFVTGSAKGVL